MLSTEKLSTFNEDQEFSRNKKALVKLGGAEGVLKGLNTSLARGIEGKDEDIKSRKESYGSNEVYYLIFLYFFIYCN